ncbi:hypothetical protein BLNAU_3704 [Blattamonas nauphoetae]|uniref:Uncharacterized protein n=1 Tax=Blattamonas nauphoetae TaxID=2049346 RepID=A0ABQ9YBW6_9EUKA|nr:hypothetical protein BLNAU_3704 [Blattamonas nauphoetae]
MKAAIVPPARSVRIITVEVSSPFFVFLGGTLRTSFSPRWNGMSEESVMEVIVFTHRIWRALIGGMCEMNDEINRVKTSAQPVGRIYVIERLSELYTIRPCSTAVTIVAKLSSKRIILLASLATSVPLIPIAIPTCACFSAGESFTPSPVIATMCFFLWNDLTIRSLSAGVARAKMSQLSTRASSSSSVMVARSFDVLTTDWSSPSKPPIAAAVFAWSPVIITTLMEAAWQRSMATFDSARGGSKIPTTPSSVNPPSYTSSNEICSCSTSPGLYRPSGARRWQRQIVRRPMAATFSVSSFHQSTRTGMVVSWPASSMVSSLLQREKSFSGAPFRKM